MTKEKSSVPSVEVGEDSELEEQNEDRDKPASNSRKRDQSPSVRQSSPPVPSKKRKSTEEGNGEASETDAAFVKHVTDTYQIEGILCHNAVIKLKENITVNL